MGRFERRSRAASRRHWAILIACVVVVLVVLGLAVGERVEPGVVLLPAPSRAAASDVAIVAAVSTASTAPPTQAAQPNVDRSGQIEVCGVGWVKAGAGGGLDKEALSRLGGVEAEVDRLVGALASSDDEFERASTLWLLALRTPNAGVPVPSPETPCDGEACAFSAPAATSADKPLERLAQQATTTRDPRVYALAFKACRGSEEGSCSLLDATRWAQVDGDNGEPWLYVLAQAEARKDTALTEEAIFRIGVAPRIDMRYFAVPRAVAERAGTGDAGLQAADAVAIMAIGGMAAMPLPSIAPLTQSCRGAWLSDANRRQRCDAAASALAERSDNMLYAQMGTAMGRHLGWSDARIDAVGSLSKALQESLPVQEANPWAWSCRTIATMLARMSRQGAVGETGFAREWIEASGTTLERYAALEHEQRQRRSDAFRAAASAAKAAASASGEAGASAPAR